MKIIKRPVVLMAEEKAELSALAVSILAFEGKLVPDPSLASTIVTDPLAVPSRWFAPESLAFASFMCQTP